MPKPYPREFREDVVRVARNREPGSISSGSPPFRASATRRRCGDDDRDHERDNPEQHSRGGVVGGKQLRNEGRSVRWSCTCDGSLSDSHLVRRRSVIPALS